MSPRTTVSEGLLVGAASGFGVALGYAVLELWLAAVLPWFIVDAQSYRQFAPKYSVALLVLYIVVCSIVGALYGIAASRFSPYFRSGSREFRRNILSAMVAVAIVAVIHIALPDEDVSPDRLALSRDALAGVTLGALAGFRFRWLRVLSEPLIILGLYIGPMAISDSLSSRGASAWVRISAMGLFAVGLLIVGMVVQHLRRNPVTQTDTFLQKGYLAAVAGMYVAALAVTGWLVPQPLRASLATATPATKTNVFIIVLDTVRADHLSLYGYKRETTPNLKQFASRATLFTEGTAASHWTLPTHASILTGLYPSRHGAHHVNSRVVGLSSQQRTLSEILAEKGFATAAVVANASVVTGWMGFLQGFSYYDESWPPYVVGWHWVSKPTLRPLLRGLAPHLPVDTVRNTRSAEQINQAVGQALDELQPSRRPIFMMVNYMDAHYPFLASKPFDTRFGSPPSLLGVEQFEALEKEVLSHERSLTEEERRHLEPHYDSAIAYLDSELGVLFEQLKKRSLFDDSLIIVVGDHGEAFGEKALVEHSGVAVFQEQVHIPFLVKYPHQQSATVVERRVSQVDIVPTVMDSLGLPVPNGLDGVSLLKLDSAPQRSILSEAYPTEETDELNKQRFGTPIKAVHYGGWKLISSSGGYHALFNLETDPQEKVNAYQASPQIATDLNARLTALLGSLGQNKTGGKAPGAQALDRLKSLGYVGGR